MDVSIHIPGVIVCLSMTCTPYMQSMLVYDVASVSNENAQMCSGLLARHTLDAAVTLNDLNASSFSHLRAQREALSTLQILLPSGMSELRKWIDNDNVKTPLRELAGHVMGACGDYSVQSLVSELVYRIQKSGIKLTEALGADSAFNLRSFQRVVRKRRVDDLLRELRIFINEHNDKVLADERSVTSFRLLSVAAGGDKCTLSDEWVDFGHNHCTIYLDEHGQSLPVDIPYDSLEHVNIRGGSTTTAHVRIALRSVPDVVKSTFAPDGKVDFEFDERASDIERLLEARKPGRDMKIDSQNVSEMDGDDDNNNNDNDIHDGDAGGPYAEEEEQRQRAKAFAYLDNGGGSGSGGSGGGTDSAEEAKKKHSKTNDSGRKTKVTKSAPAESNFEMSDLSEGEKEEVEMEMQRKRGRGALGATQTIGSDRKKRSTYGSRSKRAKKDDRRNGGRESIAATAARKRGSKLATTSRGHQSHQHQQQQQQVVKIKDDHSPEMSVHYTEGANLPSQRVKTREPESAHRQRAYRHRIDAPRQRDRVVASDGSPQCTELVVYGRGAGAGGIVIGNDALASDETDLAKAIGRRRESMKMEANSALRDTFREIRTGLKESLQDIHEGVSEHRRLMLKMCSDRLGGFETKLVNQVSSLYDRQNAFAEQMAEELTVHREALRGIEDTRMEIEEMLDTRSRDLLDRVAHVESEANTLINNTENCVRQAIRGMNNTSALKSVINAML